MVRLGALLLKGILAVCLAGLLLGVMLPLLHRQHITPPEWLVWVVVAGILAAIIGPEVWSLRRSRRQRTSGQ
jgi:hypothetical protein